MNISGYFSKHEISEELIIPFASSKPAILMVAGSDDQLCPSVYFVSSMQRLPQHGHWQFEQN